MTNKNKEIALNALDKLQPYGATNMWAGLLTGMNELKNNPTNSNH